MGREEKREGGREGGRLKQERSDEEVKSLPASGSLCVRGRAGAGEGERAWPCPCRQRVSDMESE